MIKSFIKIRLKQIFRELVGIGLIRSVFLMGLLSFFGLILFLGSEEEENANYFTLGYIFLLFIIQIRRKDKTFLKTHFTKYRHMLQVEYLLLITPLVVCLFYHLHWVQLSVLFLGSILIPFINYIPQKRSLNTKLQKIIPNDMYEWKSGARRLLFIVLPIWIIGLFTSFFIGSIPLAILVIGVLLLNLYETGEPYQMIVALEKGSHKFIIRKIQLQIMTFTGILLPLFFSFILFHIEYWYIVAVEYILFSSLHAFFIITKYAYYKPNVKHPAAQTMNMLGTLGIIIPFLLPIVWGFSVVLYYKAKNNLNYYLNDFN